jgi:hypothetical protein
MVSKLAIRISLAGIGKTGVRDYFMDWKELRQMVCVLLKLMME